MFKKTLLPAAIVAVSQLGMAHPVSGMEKEPEVKSEQQEEEYAVSEELSEQEKEQLFQKFKAMKQLTEEGLPQDVQGYIGQHQHAVAPRSIFKFKCPTPDQLRNKLGKPEKAVGLFFPIVEDLKFSVMARDGVSNAEKLTGIQIIQIPKIENSVYHFSCSYNQGPNDVLNILVEIPRDKYVLTSETPDSQNKYIQVGSEDQPLSLFNIYNDNVEFTLTKKEPQK